MSEPQRDSTPEPGPKATGRPVAPSRSWVRLDALLRFNPKVDGLSDAEFRAWIMTLCAAKLAQSEGEWPSEAYYRLAVGDGPAAQLSALVSARLLERGADGWIRVHDWQDWQPSDPTAAERARRYRERQKAREAGASDGPESVTRDVTAATRDVTQTRRDVVDVTRRDVTDVTPPGQEAAAPVRDITYWNGRRRVSYCESFIPHQSSHRRDGAEWVCDACPTQVEVAA